MNPMISAGSMIGLTRRSRRPEVIRIKSSRQLGQTASNSDGLIPCATFAMLLEAAARITGDSYFGLHFGERTNPKNVGPLIYVTLNSPNIATSLENAGRYFKIHNETAHLSLMIEGDRAVICQHWLILGSVRYGSGVRYPPNDGRKPVSTRQVYFARETPDQISEHLRIFGAPHL